MMDIKETNSSNSIETITWMETNLVPIIIAWIEKNSTITVLIVLGMVGILGILVIILIISNIEKCWNISCTWVKKHKNSILYIMGIGGLIGLGILLGFVIYKRIFNSENISFWGIGKNNLTGTGDNLFWGIGGNNSTGDASFWEMISALGAIAVPVLLAWWTHNKSENDKAEVERKVRSDDKNSARIDSDRKEEREEREERYRAEEKAEQKRKDDYILLKDHFTDWLEPLKKEYLEKWNEPIDPRFPQKFDFDGYSNFISRVYRDFEQFFNRGLGTAYGSQLVELRSLILRVHSFYTIGLTFYQENPNKYVFMMFSAYDFLQAVFTSIEVLQNDTLFQTQKRDLEKKIKSKEDTIKLSEEINRQQGRK